MANISYTLSSKPIAGRAEVRVRFYQGKEIDQQTRTGIFVPVNSWNAAEGRCLINRRYETPENKEARQAQADLDDLTAYIYKEYTRARSHAGKWLQKVVQEWRDPQPQEPPIADYIPEYCQARQVAEATRKKMHTLGHHLSDYQRAMGRVITATNIDGHTLDQFAGFLISQGMSRNSASGRLRQLRTLLYWVGKPHPNPFDNYTIPADIYGSPIYLTEEERDALYAFKWLSPAKKVQRDIFIFQCYTGCRVSDLIALTPANVRDGWLVYIPKKTTRHEPTTIELPLAPVALEIVERYKGADLHGRLLPFIAPQKYNEAVQEVCRQAFLERPVMVFNPKTFETHPVPLWRVVTSHTARKTFIQIAYERTGDKRLVASMSGHSENSQAFNRYSEVSRAMKLAALIPENFPKGVPTNTQNAPQAKRGNSQQVGN